jgi:predicted nucleic acid-binding protein
MKVVFADTSYYLALINSSDRHHSRVCQWTAAWNGAFLTTAWVVAELANAMSQTPNRPFFLSLMRDLQTDPRVTILPPTKEIFDRGLDLFSRRPDKDWSLTDCISFLVMEDYRVPDAATLDRHFAQAGFNVLILSV